MVAAKKDPETFIANLPKDKLNIIDEIQRVPEIYFKLKKGIVLYTGEETVPFGDKLWAVPV